MAAPSRQGFSTSLIHTAVLSATDCAVPQACYPAALITKVHSKEELVGNAMLTDQRVAKPESNDNAC